MTREQLLALHPPRSRVHNPRRGLGTVDAVALLPGGPVLYITWDTPTYSITKGEAVAWREAVVPSMIRPVPLW
jgi:predicted NUDIX family NTP pyrophosphohydrolase